MLHCHPLVTPVTSIPALAKPDWLLPFEEAIIAVKPYQECDRWSFCVRTKGQDICRNGFTTCAEARREAERLSVACLAKKFLQS